MKVDKKQEELNAKARMSQRAYLQRQLTHKKDFMQTYKFSLKFMSIAMPIAFAIFLAFTIIAYSTFMLISTIICGLILLAVIVWLIVYKTYHKPKMLGEIKEIEDKIGVFLEEDSQKIRKMAEHLASQNKTNKK